MSARFGRGVRAGAWLALVVGSFGGTLAAQTPHEGHVVGRPTTTPVVTPGTAAAAAQAGPRTGTQPRTPPSPASPSATGHAAPDPATGAAAANVAGHHTPERPPVPEGAQANTAPAGQSPPGVNPAGAMPPGHPPVGAAPATAQDPHTGLREPAQEGATGTTSEDPHGAGADPHGAGSDPHGAGGDPHGAQGAGPHGESGMPGGVRSAQLPESFSREASDLPPGVVLVRVIDAAGQPVADAPVRLGMMREGERQSSREARTRPDGVAQFEGLDTGSSVSYRPSTDHEGARFGAMPFMLPTRSGYRVQLVRFEVEHEPRSLLISEARIEIGFQDDRLVVIQRASIVNFSAIAFGGAAPRPMAFVPREGLRFRLPQGFSVFSTQPAGMGDQRITEEGGHAVLRGSIPPGDPRAPTEVVFQYRVKLEGRETIDLDVTWPLPVLRTTIVTQAPEGMRLEVDGMPQAESRTHNGQRILITGRERQGRGDAPLTRTQVHLIGIPAVAGPERTIALIAAIALLLGSIAYGFRAARERSSKASTKVREAALNAQKERLLSDAALLAKAHRDGEVGVETYARRRREIAQGLARVLKDLAELKEPARA